MNGERETVLIYPGRTSEKQSQKGEGDRREGKWEVEEKSRFLFLGLPDMMNHDVTGPGSASPSFERNRCFASEALRTRTD